MSKAVTKEEVAERLHRHVLDNYTLLADVSKGIALAIGSAALLTILVNLRSEWMRLLPWLGSMAAVIISYVKWNRGAILTNARASTWDAVFPMLMGVDEFLLFAILVVDKQNLPQYLWLNWPVLIAIHAFTATGLVSNRIRLTDVSRDFEASKDMSDLGRNYVVWMKKDRFQTTLIGTIALTVWVIWAVGHCWILQTPDRTRHWAWFVGASALAFFAGAWKKPIPDANRERNEIDTFVSK
ncbi:MAG: hypothetical protein WA405_08865 [Candidatus Acidiferrales bacterium]